MSKVQTISVISFLSFCIIVGCLVFARGFLLNRQTIQHRSGSCLNTPSKSVVQSLRDREENYESSSLKPVGNYNQDTYGENPNKKGGLWSNWCNSSPPFTKMILVLVDALRFDFVQRMKFLSRILEKQSKSSQREAAISSCLFKFVADPPTTTMQRLKALMTGTMPTFIDASANFNSYEIEEDSLIYQLEAAGKKIAFLGDDTWLSLFPEKYFKSPFVEAHPSFNAWDLDTVDRAVNKTLRKILLPDHKDDWDVLITHFLGVDHCGHRYGPNHPEMIRKLNETDKIVEHVFNTMSEDTLLVVFGDHGMTSTGDHGGDSHDETDAAIIFLSKQLERQKQINPPFQCSKQFSISQIDLVPTLASLIGIPVPYSNIGQIIPDFLPKRFYSDAVAANVAQVHKYIQHFSMILSSVVVNESSAESGQSLLQQYDKIEEAFREYQSSRNSTTRAKLHLLSKNYLTQVKAIAVSTWTQFNIPMIYTGVAISLLSVLSLVLYLAIVPKFFNQDSAQQNYTVLSWLWPSLAHWAVLWTFVYHPNASSGLLGIVVSTLSGVIVFLLIILFKASQIIISNLYKNRKQVRKDKFYFIYSFVDISEISAVVVYFFTCLVVFSNSFVINEGSLLGASMIFIVLFRLISSKRDREEFDLNLESDNPPTFSLAENLLLLPKLKIKREIKCSWSCFIILASAIRISFVFFRCREEQVTCNEDFLLHKQLSSLPEDWMVHKYLRYGIALVSLAVFVVCFRHWMMFRKCIFSRKPRAIIGRFIPSMLVVLLGVFWALQGLPYISSNASKVRLLMNYLPLVYQAITISSLVFVWIKPVCCVGPLRVFWNPLSKSSFQEHFTTSTFMTSEIFQKGYKLPKCETASKRKSIPNFNGIKKPNGINGTISPSVQNDSINNSSSILNQDVASSPMQRKSSFITKEHKREGPIFSDCYNEDTYSSSILTFLVLLTLLLVQVTSTGIAPAVILEVLCVICLVGIYRCSNKYMDSWSSVIAWTLLSQYFFYATGHQPIFSAIPWDSAFVGTGDGTGLANSSGSWFVWSRAALSVVGNLHVSQIIVSFSLPLMVYWNPENGKLESSMGKSEAKKAYLVCGKFIALHGLKLLMCMACAAWHRRHLMVWKIFAPKFIFEAISFIVTSSAVLLSMVFVNRIHYFHQLFLSKGNHQSV